MYKSDCIHYKGAYPCNPHKKFGYKCVDCPEYSAVKYRILIIKLGAIGDVIRTTPLITKIRKEYPNSKITWVTLSPEVLPASEIDEIWKLDSNTSLILSQSEFDVAINLDKEKEAGALLSLVSAKQKFGFILKNNEIFEVDSNANHKMMTGLFDDISKANKKSYLEEIFEICGWKYDGEPYLMDKHADKGFVWDLDRSKKIIGLNTGCGGRWTTRLWPTEKWVDLIELLKKSYPNAQILLLGGEQEHNRNKELADRTNAKYLGYFSLNQFINLVSLCDLVVTQVTMAMHISLAVGTKLVLMNNIFNPNEFALFDKGILVQPEKACKCFYKGTCVDGGVGCMDFLTPSSVLEAIKKLV